MVNQRLIHWKHNCFGMLVERDPIESSATSPVAPSVKVGQILSLLPSLLSLLSYSTFCNHDHSRRRSEHLSSRISGRATQLVPMPRAASRANTEEKTADYTIQCHRREAADTYKCSWIARLPFSVAAPVPVLGRSGSLEPHRSTLSGSRPWMD